MLDKQHQELEMEIFDTCSTDMGLFFFHHNTSDDATRARGLSRWPLTIAESELEDY